MLSLVALLALSNDVLATPAVGTTPTLEPTAPGFVLDDKKEPPKGWTGSVALSASKSSGNTDKNTAGATANAENRTDDDRWTLQFLWNYSDEKGVGVTARRTYGQVKYDRFLSKKLYAFGVVSGENDFAAALDLRTTIGAGVGYQFREDTEWKISGEAGLAYVDENFSTAGDDKDFLAARLAYKADWTINTKWAVGQWAEVFPSLEDKEDVSARVDTHLKLALTEKMFAQLQHIYTWDNTPATGADRVDELYLLSLGWSF